MDVKSTERDADAFLTEHWHGWIILLTVHRDRQF